MLAKIWKKVLFAICVIACLYNVMSKLIQRMPLDVQLKSVRNQTSIINELDDDTEKQNENITSEKMKENNNNNNNNNNENNNLNEVEEKNNTIVVVY